MAEGTPYCASCGVLKKANRINGKLQSRETVYNQPTCGKHKCLREHKRKTKYQFVEKPRPEWESCLDRFNAGPAGS